MGCDDAARPRDGEFQHVLQQSLETWSSYLESGRETRIIPRQAIDLHNLVSRTPPFLGDASAPDETFSFACEEKQSVQGKDSIVVNCRSTWRTSKGECDLPLRELPKQLLLAVGSRLSVRLTQDSPLSDWPGVEGLEGYDKGNYLSVLYFAWAYILSARWVEVLSHSADHECHMDYNTQGLQSSEPSDEEPAIEIDLGQCSCEDEVLWWCAILCSAEGWNATTKYNGHVYLSPWSISVNPSRLTPTRTTFAGVESGPPSSDTALKYLSRFCLHHRLYAQCSVALAGVLFIPFLRGREICLPFPKNCAQSRLNEYADHSSVSILDLVKKHGELLPKYLTLGSNIWGLRSVLCSTFFNPDIQCNLVSAWLNPAFAVLNTISSRKWSVATVLANRKPSLGILWLGAVLTDLATSILRDVRAGMAALDISASAWTGIQQTFLTSAIREVNDESIRREDECRLLFITASEGHDRPPIWPWKPFGTTKLCDAELPVQQHARCAVHCLEYESWEWILTNGRSIRCFGADNFPLLNQEPDTAFTRSSAVHGDYKQDLFSQSLSEGATRGIFEWLRSNGYPLSERDIYKHSWIDLEGTDEDELDDTESDVEIHSSPQRKRVEYWLDSIE